MNNFFKETSLLSFVKKRGEKVQKECVTPHHKTHAAKPKSKRNSNKPFHQTNALNIMKKQ